MSVVSWEADATQTVLDHNQFNDPPPEGSVYSLIRLALAYTGDSSGNPWVDLTWRGLGSSNVASESGECYTFPDNIFDVPEMFTGGSAEANICLTVLESDIAGLVLMLEESMSFDDTRVFMALP